MKFRTRPCEITAFQFDGTNRCAIEIEVWTRGKAVPYNTNLTENTCEWMFIETLEGTMQASVGDWIIMGLGGEFYPCKPDMFDKKYEEVLEYEGAAMGNLAS